MNFPVRLVPPGSESLRRHLGRTSEFFIKASGWDGASGGRGHARGTPALIKVPKQEGKCDKSTCASVCDREVATNSSSVTSPRWPGNMCRRLDDDPETLLLLWKQLDYQSFLPVHLSLRSSCLVNACL